MDQHEIRTFSKNIDKVLQGLGVVHGSGFQDRTLAVKNRKNARKSSFFVKKLKITIFFLQISSSSAKILGETNFQPPEFPQSGSKAKDGEKKRERERKTER